MLHLYFFRNSSRVQGFLTMDASSAFSRMSWYSSFTSFVPRIFSNTLRAYVKFERQTISMDSQLRQRHVQSGRLWCDSLKIHSMGGQTQAL